MEVILLQNGCDVGVFSFIFSKWLEFQQMIILQICSQEVDSSSTCLFAKLLTLKQIEHTQVAEKNISTLLFFLKIIAIKNLPVMPRQASIEILTQLKLVKTKKSMGTVKCLFKTQHLVIVLQETSVLVPWNRSEKIQCQIFCL